jgi:hypothetical protein
METIDEKVKKLSNDLYNEMECKRKCHIEETYEDFMNRYNGFKSKDHASISINIKTFDKEHEMYHIRGEKFDDFIVRYNRLKSEGHKTMSLNIKSKEEIMSNLRSIDNKMDTYMDMEIMRRKEAVIKAKTQEKTNKLARWASEVEKRMNKMKQRKVVWR